MTWQLKRFNKEVEMDEKKKKINVRLVIWTVVCSLLSAFIAIMTFRAGNYILGAVISCYAIGGVVFAIVKKER